MYGSGLINNTYYDVRNNLVLSLYPIPVIVIVSHMYTAVSIQFLTVSRNLVYTWYASGLIIII